VGLAGGCLPLFIQLPIIFTLFYSWRRLRAERFEHFDDPWLWVPSLSQPNPDFDWKLDWLLQFNGSEPAIGWDIWLRQLILPAIVVSVAIYKNLKSEDERDKERNFFKTNWPVLLTIWITLELPQVMSIYYLAFNVAGLVETEFSKVQIRKEMPAFEAFERTGQFPEGNFDEIFFPNNLHEACKKGNVRGAQQLLEEGDDFDELDETGTAPIGYAVAFGSLPLASVLCIRGADILRKDKAGNTLLHIAAAYDHADVFKYLIGFGSELHEEWAGNKWAAWKNDLGYTVVDMAQACETGRVLKVINSSLGIPAEAEVVQAKVQVEARARTVD